MKGMFSNARGIGCDIKKRFIRETVCDLHIDFLGIQETIKDTFSPNELHSLCGVAGGF